MSATALPLLSQLIRHDAFERACAEIEALITHKDPRSGLVIPFLGPTRTGKNEVVKYLRKKIGRSPTGTALILPKDDFGIGKLTPKPSDRDLYRAILGAVERKWHDGENADVLRRRVVTAIRETGVRVIAIDECNHAAERGANLSARAAADHFKTVVDDTGVCLILFGLPRFQAIVDGNEQLRDRSSNTVYFRPYDWQIDAERDAFAGVVYSALDAIRRAGATVDIGFEDLTPRLYGASGGRVPRALRILKGALLRASHAPLSCDLLQTAAKELQQRPISPQTFFQEEVPEDALLIRSYAAIMAEAGLTFDVHTPSGLQVKWDMRSAS
jgi:hypothetical protein